MFVYALAGIVLTLLAGGRAGSAGAGGAQPQRQVAVADYGVDDNFMKDLGSKLEPGTAALIVLVRKVTIDKILENVQERGEVIQSSLNNEGEARLSEALQSAGTSAS